MQLAARERIGELFQFHQRRGVTANEVIRNNPQPHRRECSHHSDGGVQLAQRLVQHRQVLCEADQINLAADLYSMGRVEQPGMQRVALAKAVAVTVSHGEGYLGFDRRDCPW